jgi:D-serine deaminase-like pyridoxal phosphate-dependent protein
MIDVVKPTLLLNKEKCLNNLNRINKLAELNNINFRPHFKTHQSLEVGRWFKKFGVKSITVSSVSMAKYFSDEWDDILIAFPLNILELEEIKFLQEKIKLSILIDSYETLKSLDMNLKHKINVYLKVDVGYNRAGIRYDNIESINKIINFSESSDIINFMGFISHFGNTYNSKSEDEIKEVFLKSIKKLKNLNNLYPNIDISIGDTPSCSIIEDYPDFITEIRPGNFIYYDIAQFKIGSCQINDIAVRVVCPIISIYEDRKSLLIYCGSVHLSKDYIIENGKKCYGYVYQGDYWSSKNKIGNIVSLSQEHGIVEYDKNKEFKVGQKVSVIPIHSCLTVDKMRKLYCDDLKIEIMN